MFIVHRSSIVLALVLLACSKDLMTAPQRAAPEVTIGSLTAAPRVILVAVGSTAQVGFATRALTGAPLNPLDSVLFHLNTLSDTLRVKVSRTGLITALSPTTTPVLLNVFGFKAGVAKADQVFVQVTSSAIAGLSLSLQPVAPDSARLAAGTAKTIVPVLRNASTGQSMANLVMRYFVSAEDAKRVLVYTPALRVPGGTILQLPPPFPSPGPDQIVALVSEGTGWIHGELDAYGTRLRDSVQYTFTYPFSITIRTRKENLAITSVFDGRTVTLAAGAVVTFANQLAADDPTAITYSFDNPGAATAASPASTSGGGAGDVTPLSGGQSSRRRFLSAGTYRWTRTAIGGSAPFAGQTASGTIIIR